MITQLELQMRMFRMVIQKIIKTVISDYSYLLIG